MLGSLQALDKHSELASQSRDRLDGLNRPVLLSLDVHAMQLEKRIGNRRSNREVHVLGCCAALLPRVFLAEDTRYYSKNGP